MFHPAGPTLTELVRQALSSTEHGYDLLAPKFEHTPFRTPDRLLAAVAPLIGSPGSVGSAIDLCCGTGAAMRMLRPLCRHEVVGVDFSAGMLREARRCLVDAPGEAALGWVQADVCSLRLSERFDVATCFGALGHVPVDREDEFLAAVAGLLDAGGRFVFVTCEQPRWFEPRALLSRAFNLAMAARNALHSPPFIMFYLRFTLPTVQDRLERHGFECAVHALGDPDLPRELLAVVATRR